MGFARQTWLLALTLPCGLAHAEAPVVAAPFGLTWNLTQTEIEKMGITLSDCDTKDGETACTVNLVPKPPEHIVIDSYRLRFDADGLMGATVFSANIPGDKDGTVGKSVYETMRKDLVALYGEGERSEKVGQVKPYVGADEFYECLDFDGCGEWRSSWAAGSVALSLKGLHPGEGYLMENFYRPN